LGSHPGHGDGGVEPAGEGDADPLADGQGGEDLAHCYRLSSSAHGTVIRRSCSHLWSAASDSPDGIGPPSASARNQEATASPPAGSVVTTNTVSSPAIVPRMSARSAWSIADARYWAAPGGVRSTTRFADARAETRISSQTRTRRASTTACSPGRGV